MQSDRAPGSSKPAPAATAGQCPVGPRLGKPQWLATLALTVSLLASLLLTLADLNTIGLPGCSAGSACDAASKSVWGKVPGLGWPTAYVGLAWFSGVFVWWMLSGQTARGLATPGRILLRVSAIGSLFLLTVSAFGGYRCSYCIAANLANVAFVLLLVWSWRAAAADAASAGSVSTGSQTSPATGRVTVGVVIGAVAGLLVSGVLAVLQAQSLAAAKQRDQAALSESTAKILEATAKQGESAAPKLPTESPKTEAQSPKAQTPPVTAANSAAKPVVPVQEPTRPPAPEPVAAAAPLTGRHRLGPEVAQVRLVVFTDYQCPDCKNLEADLVRIAAENPTVSLSVRHFPLCAACNPEAGTNMHPNACWAARFTEAAAILGGPAKFWEAHKLMFEVGGSFTDAEFPKLVQRLGLSIKAFSDKMQSQETLDRVKLDIASGFAVGLTMTPMLFVNGVELRGAHLPGAAQGAVSAVLASSPAARDASADVPPGALQRAMVLWRNAGAVSIASEPDRFGFGATIQNSVVSVLVIGDLQDPLTSAADAELRGLCSEIPGLRYDYRHYPMDKKCQPVGVVDRYPNACFAARAVEAAGLLGGEPAMQSMQAWLVNNRQRLTDQLLPEAAAAAGVNPSDLLTKLTDPLVDARIAADIALGKRLAVKSLPSVWVNGKRLVTLKAGDQSVLAAVVREAAAQPRPVK